MKLPGISVIICCYNSEKRLPETLGHLSRQEFNNDIPWEILLVDNLSTDKTTDVASRIWANISSTPIRFTRESQAGLSFARLRGLSEAMYEYLCFIDDDNWVSRGYLNGIYKIFTEHPEVGACGGAIVEHCETDPPFWFESFKGNYAIWRPSDSAGYLAQPLCGAAMGIRRSAWMSLNKNGFRAQLVDRKGTNLSSGGDFELCLALLLANWKLWFDPELLVRHFLPRERLNWSYLKKLNIGFGNQSVFLDPYESQIKTRDSQMGMKYILIKECMLCIKNIIRHAHWILADIIGFGEGKEQVLLYLGQWGRLKTLYKSRAKYRNSFLKMQQASWHTTV